MRFHAKRIQVKVWECRVGPDTTKASGVGEDWVHAANALPGV